MGPFCQDLLRNESNLVQCFLVAKILPHYMGVNKLKNIVIIFSLFFFFAHKFHMRAYASTRRPEHLSEFATEFSVVYRTEMPALDLGRCSTFIITLITVLCLFVVLKLSCCGGWFIHKNAFRVRRSPEAA